MRLLSVFHCILQLITSISLAGAFSVSVNSNAPAAINAGDKLPFVDLDYGFPPQKVNVVQYCAGRSVVIVGLPGAFTPT